MGINLLKSQKTYIRTILNEANYFAKATVLISFISLTHSQHSDCAWKSARHIFSISGLLI